MPKVLNIFLLIKSNLVQVSQAAVRVQFQIKRKYWQRFSLTKLNEMKWFIIEPKVSFPFSSRNTTDLNLEDCLGQICKVKGWHQEIVDSFILPVTEIGKLEIFCNRYTDHLIKITKNEDNLGHSLLSFEDWGPDKWFN